MTEQLGLRIGTCSDPGRQREANEDSYLVLTAPAKAAGIDAVLAVADGLGGHQAGHVASQALVEALSTLFRSGDYQQIVAYSPQHPDYYVVVLKEALERINEQICDMTIGHPELDGMGTTATVAILSGGQLFWGHVGDTRAYLLHDGILQQLTQDHTWVALQVESGALSADEAAHHPRRNLLMQSLGGSLFVRVERGSQAVRSGDLLLLCSDGLTGVLSDAEIQTVLAAKADPQAACERLVALANRRGGPDNITAVIAQIVDGGPHGGIAEGLVVGPARRGPPTEPRPNAPGAEAGPFRRDDDARAVLTAAAAALIGASVCGLAAFGLRFAPLSPTLSLLTTGLVTALTFVVGTAAGWLLRPSASRLSKEETTP